MKNKPLCILVDDVELNLDALKREIEEIGLLEVERVFTDPDKFLAKVSDLKSEIIFLDMEMHIHGIEVAQKLKGKKIIFVSGHTDEAIKAFDIDAIDFVPKPILTSRLKQAIEKVLKQISSSVIVLRTEDARLEEILSESIVYITTNVDDKRDKDIHMNNGSIITAKQYGFEDLVNVLPPGKFLKINHSEIVNLSFVTKLMSKDLIGINLKDNKLKEVTLGDNYKAAFFEHKPHLKP